MMEKIRNNARDTLMARLAVCLCVGFALMGRCVAGVEQAPEVPCLVVKAGRAGFIDARGRLLVAPRYARCGRWSEGRLWVQEQAGPDALGTFLDERAKPVSPLQFHDLAAVRPELPLPRFEKGVAVIEMPAGGFGYLNAQGQVMAQTTQAGAFQRQDSELLICVVSNRVGFIDRAGQTVILAQYEEATSFRSGHAAVRQGAQWGLIDTLGNWVVKPAFEHLRPASGDARIWSYREEEHWGLIDCAGRKLSDALYVDVGVLSGSAIAVQGATGWGLVSEAGAELVKPQYANLFPFKKDTSLWMAQSSAGKWGVVSTNDQKRVMCSFDYIVAAPAEIWLAQQGGLWGILDLETGRWRVPALFNRILSLEPPFKNIMLVEQSGKWGVVAGDTGKALIETRYGRIGQWGAFLAIEDGRTMKLLDIDLREVLIWEGAFEGLLHYAALKGDSGVLVTARGVTRITRDGELPWDDFFEDAGEWSDGFLAVKRKGHWGLVNEAGMWVLHPAFESVGSVAEGVAPVCENRRWGLIRLNGNQGERLFTTEAEMVGRAWRGLVPVMRGGLWGLIDFNGKDVLPCEYDTLEWGTDEAGYAQFYGVDPVQTHGLRFYGKPSAQKRDKTKEVTLIDDRWKVKGCSQAGRATSSRLAVSTLSLHT